MLEKLWRTINQPRRVFVSHNSTHDRRSSARDQKLHSESSTNYSHSPINCFTRCRIDVRLLWIELLACSYPHVQNEIFNLANTTAKLRLSKYEGRKMVKHKTKQTPVDDWNAVKIERNRNLFKASLGVEQSKANLGTIFESMQMSRPKLSFFFTTTSLSLNLFNRMLEWRKKSLRILVSCVARLAFRSM